MNRREFLCAGTTALASLPLLAQNSPGKTYKACVWGHTGRGGYGHGLDVTFQKIPNVTVTAVADPDEKGRSSAMKRVGAPRAYADLKEMLDKEKPDLVSHGPRWVERRLETLTLCAEAGAHVFMEKPMALSLEEADAVLAAAEKHKTRIAIAHHVRATPTMEHLKKLIDGGLIGDVLEMRTRGKEDNRAGGEDMMVLGTHCMYMMRYFGGDPLWCSARVTQEGRDVTAADRRAATEPLGPIAGDCIHATYAFPKGIQGHFASQKVPRGQAGRFQMEIYGSKGAVQFQLGHSPQVHHLSDPLWSPGKTGSKWQPLPDAPSCEDPSGLKGTEACNKRIIEDLIRAVETGGQSIVSGYEGRAALEMILAVYASHLSGARAAFPLKDRKHPLGTL